MSRRTLFVLACLALAVVAAGMRFHRLGDWAFTGDELATLDEADRLFQAADGPLTSQADRLPRALPVSYSLHSLTYAAFGRDEWGSRVLGAVLATVQVVAVFVGLVRPLGAAPALATALLLLLWPEHLYRSQENRFYMTTALFASLAMLAGSQAVARRSMGWTLAACACCFAALLSHTLQAVLFGGLFLALAAAARAARERPLARLPLIVIGAGLAAGGFVLVYVVPLLRGWNGDQAWGYGVAHSVMAAVSQIGWPTALLAGVGAAAVVWQRDEQGWYWLTWAGVWFAAALALPFVVAYHPGYVFPLSLGVLVLAGRAVALVYDGLREQRPLAAYAWVGLACMFNLPGVFSHYADGNRSDIRTAAQFVSRHVQPGDRVSAFSNRLVQHYAAPGVAPIALSLARPLESVQKLSATPERMWIVVASGRAGKPDDLARWLGKHCTLEMQRRPKRYDYYENVTEVYLYTPGPNFARVTPESEPAAAAARR